MGTPLVSIGIPFFNCEHCLLDAVRSIIAQTYQNWELILVDDGSTDGSLDLARSINDPRVRVLTPDGKNKRLPARLNQISQAARGKFIARMDADDMSAPKRLTRQLKFLTTHKEVDVVGTSMYITDKKMESICKITVPETHETITKNKFESVSMAHATIMARAEWFCSGLMTRNVLAHRIRNCGCVRLTKVSLLILPSRSISVMSLLPPPCPNMQNHRMLQQKAS